jgi:phage/plasmid-like protein (TIGR03299 family)
MKGKATIMGHDILANRMFVSTESAWHFLGNIKKDMTSFVAAVNSVPGMDFNIHKMPLTATMPDGTTIDTGSYGLFRDPIDSDGYAFLGTCGSSYEYFQNAQIAERMDDLAKLTGWKFATMGVIHNGATIFSCLDMGDYEIKGDSFSRYFAYNESRDGKTASSAIASNVRIVCRNTHDLALAKANSRLNIRHHGGYRNMATWALELIAAANNAHAETLQAIEQLFAITVNDTQFDSIVSAIVPLPTMPNLLQSGLKDKVAKEKLESVEYIYQNKVAGVNRMRNAIVENWVAERTIQTDHLGTGYHAYQAVTEYISNQHGTLGSRGRKMDAHARANYDLLGDGLAMRNSAYSAIMDLA